MGKCRFQLIWLQDYRWVKKSSDVRKPHCWVCMKNILIATELLKSVQKSNLRYNSYLAQQKEKKLSEEKKLKKKA